MKVKHEEGSVTETDMEKVRLVLLEKVNDGCLAAVRRLIGTYGAKKLSDIAPEKLQEFLAAAEEL